MKTTLLIGKKIGMTSIFTDTNSIIPVTVIKINTCKIAQIKSLTKDGYNAVQLASGYKKESKLKKPEIGHLKKYKTKIAGLIKELKINKYSKIDHKMKFGVDSLKNIHNVDVSGLSKGKGFAGTIKRWNFHMQNASHGNSLSHRVPGSIGQNQTPGRVFKGKKMSGHLGNEKVTIKNLKIIKIYHNDNILLVRGSVPGATGTTLLIKPSFNQN